MESGRVAVEAPSALGLSTPGADCRSSRYWSSALRANPSLATQPRLARRWKGRRVCNVNRWQKPRRLLSSDLFFVDDYDKTKSNKPNIIPVPANTAWIACFMEQLDGSATCA